MSINQILKITWTKRSSQQLWSRPIKTLEQKCFKESKIQGGRWLRCKGRYLVHLDLNSKWAKRSWKTGGNLTTIRNIRRYGSDMRSKWMGILYFKIKSKRISILKTKLWSKLTLLRSLRKLWLKQRYFLISRKLVFLTIVFILMKMTALSHNLIC